MNNRANWFLCFLLFLATTLNYLDRQTMSVLAPVVRRDLHLDNAALGWLFAIFYYSYTLAQFGVGAVLDRWNLRWAYGFGVLLWSVAAACTGLAGGFASLMAFRFLLGIAESVNWPAAMRVIARALPAEQRALANGTFTSGTSVGALIAPALILGIAHFSGWRWAFVAVGALGIVWFAVWVLFSRRPQFGSVWRERAAVQAGTRSSFAGYREILTAAAFWRVFAVTVLVNPCLYFNVNWLPTYFVQERGLTAGARLSVVLTAIYIGLGVGNYACGFCIMALARRGWTMSRARRAVFLPASALLMLCAAVPLIAGFQTAVAALVLVNMGSGAWIAMYLTMAQEVSPRNISTAAGLLGGSGSLAGALAMWGVGKVTQQTGSFAIPMACLAITAALAAVAGLAVTLGRPAEQQATA